MRLAACSTRSGSSQPTQVIRGSLRNQLSWRRANLRVPVIVCSFASSSESSPSTYLVHEPGVPHPLHPQRDPLV